MPPIKDLQQSVNTLIIATVLLVVNLSIAFFSYYPTDGATSHTSANPGVTQPTSAPAPVLDEEALQGKTIFQNNCAACHALSNEVVVGPGLQGLHTRRDEAWLLSWIKNSTKVVQGGDPYALALFQKFNKTPMPSFDFSEADIKAVLEYIRQAAK
jgi:mono/diheme cytochrome c family protein